VIREGHATASRSTLRILSCLYIADRQPLWKRREGCPAEASSLRLQYRLLNSRPKSLSRGSYNIVEGTRTLLTCKRMMTQRPYERCAPDDSRCPLLVTLRTNQSASTMCVSRYFESLCRYVLAFECGSAVLMKTVAAGGSQKTPRGRSKNASGLRTWRLVYGRCLNKGS
jgi:hypothetical protein